MRNSCAIKWAIAAAVCSTCSGACTRAPDPEPQRRSRRESADEAVKKLPPLLRERFDTDAGRKEMDQALLDKELLVEEARRRGLHKDDEIVRQVEELEDRLVVQALLKDEIKTKRPSDEEKREYWKTHPSEFTQKERVRVGRIFVASRAEPQVAEKRAGELRKKLIQKSSLADVSKEADGPERVRGGDFGFVQKDHDDRALAQAAFKLEKKGDISPVTRTEGGYSVLVLLDKTPERLVPYEEARPDVENRMQPSTERRAFDTLLKTLREKDSAARAPTAAQKSSKEARAPKEATTHSKDGSG